MSFLLARVEYYDFDLVRLARRIYFVGVIANI